MHERSLNSLRALGRPRYVNGRLFDPASYSYSNPAGTGDAVSCAIPMEPALGPFRRDQLVYYNETCVLSPLALNCKPDR